MCQWLILVSPEYFSPHTAAERAGSVNESPELASPRRILKFNSHNINSRLATASGLAIISLRRKYFMADVANKYPENAGGKYYVDNQCIDCDLCRETAPDNFKRNDDGGYSYVYKQAETPEEEARCKEAKDGCPVEAIGDNGT